MLSKKSLKIEGKLKVCKGLPDLTALVDVLFLLLIFFMVSSSFVQVSGHKVEVPKVSQAGSTVVEKVVITIDSNNKIYFNDSPMGWEILKEELNKVKSRLNIGAVILRADRRTPFGTVAKLMSLAENMGLDVFVATFSPGASLEDDF